MDTLQGIRACVFDAYGTLFDVHSAVDRHSERIGTAAAEVSVLWRSKQLQYTWLRSLMGRYTDFWQVTGDALDYALETHGLTDPSLREDLMQAYLDLACYPEVPAVLAQLQDRGIACAILSNGSPAMLAAAVDNAGLAGAFAAVLSVDEIGIYKPDPQVYRLAVERLQLAPEEISFQSSNAWDAVGAAAFGLQVVWVNRFGQRSERLGVCPDRELATLASLPEMLG
ncbi:MAG: haloacid dehalogenase type II [Acidiferrobacteraceae bacterium]|nr:haloacid dehalogenase type II [Acidiferrobacteraceae bacterium]